MFACLLHLSRSCKACDLSFCECGVESTYSCHFTGTIDLLKAALLPLVNLYRSIYSGATKGNSELTIGDQAEGAGEIVAGDIPLTMGVV